MTNERILDAHARSANDAAQPVATPPYPAPRAAPVSAPRRRLLTAAAGVSLMSALDPALRAGVWAQGSDAPEKKEVKIGFIPLTDCASVVIASVMEFDKKYGIKIVPSKEASWAAVRDKLVNGELDAAHVLYGLIYGVQMGIGGPKKDMAVLMNLNHNGQAITLSNQLKDKGADRRREAEGADRQGEARVHVRADVPHRHARDVALLLARGATASTRSRT